MEMSSRGSTPTCVGLECCLVTTGDFDFYWRWEQQRHSPLPLLTLVKRKSFRHVMVFHTTIMTWFSLWSIKISTDDFTVSETSWPQLDISQIRIDWPSVNARMMSLSVSIPNHQTKPQHNYTFRKQWACVTGSDIWQAKHRGKDTWTCHPKHSCTKEMKINKLMVHRRLCSRREANDYIKWGLVLVCLQCVQNLTHLKRKHSLSHTHNNAHIIQHIKYSIAFILEYTLHVHDYSEKQPSRWTTRTVFVKTLRYKDM